MPQTQAQTPAPENTVTAANGNVPDNNGSNGSLQQGSPDVPHVESADIILHTRGLTKVYRPLFARAGKTALDDLTIDVRRGEIFGLVGPNGSGKTTTLKLLLGLIKPTAGSIKVFGRGPRDVAV